jgi:hypothetical protein
VTSYLFLASTSARLFSTTYFNYLSQSRTCFFPSSNWITADGSIEEYVLQGMFEWITTPTRQAHDLDAREIEFSELSA